MNHVSNLQMYVIHAFNQLPPRRMFTSFRMATNFLQLFFQHLAIINMLCITCEHNVVSLIAQYHGFNHTYSNQHMLGSMARNCCQINAKSDRDDETKIYQMARNCWIGLIQRIIHYFSSLSDISNDYNGNGMTFT